MFTILYIIQVLELQNCTVTDDGIARFLTHNRSGAMCHIALDQVFGVTDKGIRTLADHCSNLVSLKLSRCSKLTASGVKYLVERCSQLKELHLNIGSNSPTISIDQCSSNSYSGRGLKKTGSEMNLAVSNDGYYSGEINNIGIRNTRSNSSGNVFHTSEGFTAPDNIDDDCLASFCNNCQQLNDLKIYNTSNVSQRGVTCLQRIDSIINLTLNNCALICDESLNSISHMPALRSLTLVNCRRITPKGVTNVILEAPHLMSLTLGCNSELFYGDVATVAEHAYDALSCTVSGCLVLSDLQSLSVSGVGGGFIRLVTVLCSNITTLDIRPDLEIRPTGGIFVGDLVEVLTVCRKLKSLDLSGISLSDEFLYSICEHSDELRHLAMRDATDKLSLTALSDVIRLAPSLASLHIDLLSNASQDNLKSDIQSTKINIEDGELEEIVKKYHGGRVHLEVEMNIAEKSMLSQPRFTRRYVELSFTPLKFLTLQNCTIQA